MNHNAHHSLSTISSHKMMPTIQQLSILPNIKSSTIRHNLYKQHHHLRKMKTYHHMNIQKNLLVHSKQETIIRHETLATNPFTKDIRKHCTRSQQDKHTVGTNRVFFLDHEATKSIYATKKSQMHIISIKVEHRLQKLDPNRVSTTVGRNHWISTKRNYLNSRPCHH